MNLIIQVVLIYLILFSILGLKTRFSYSVYITIFLLLLYIFISFTWSFKEIYHPEKIARKYRENLKAKYNSSYVKPRIVVSLSTLPSRIQGIKPTLQSILDNTVAADAIYLNLPEYSKREACRYEIPENLTDISPIVKINRVREDYGPVTKLYPTLEVETDPETIIICIDDDLVYDPRLIERLIQASDYYGGEQTICIRGWNYIKIANRFTLPLYTPFWGSRNVKVLQCYMGVLYKRKFFNDLELFKKYMSLRPCFTTDDIMISNYLSKVGVKILMTPAQLNNKKIESQSSSMLSDFNTNNNQWIKCINCQPEE